MSVPEECSLATVRQAACFVNPPLWQRHRRHGRTGHRMSPAHNAAVPSQIILQPAEVSLQRPAP